MLYVISTLSYDASLLAHFLSYYKRIGVNSFIISVNELIPGVFKEAEAIARTFDCDVKWVPASDRHLISGLEANNKEEIRVKYVNPDDWVIPADLDEFIQFPASVTRLIAEMHRHEATFIKGDFCDRISEDGRLIQTLRQPSIWEQFPLACTISKSLVKCWTHKVTLCRGDCMLSSGHHNVISPALPLVFRRCKIHHFKWRKGLIGALQRRVAIYKDAGWNCYLEAERALVYLKKYKRIRPTDFRARIGWNPAKDGIPMSSVIYTSITNFYDDLKEIPQSFKRDSEAVAFLEGTPESGSWQVLPACSEFADPCRNAKRPKILPHLYFKDIHYSLWLDGSIGVVSTMNLDEMIDRYLSDNDIALFRHRVRKCAYKEAEMCVHSERDNPDTIRQQMSRYKYENYPGNRGLAECSVILRRHTPKMRLLNELWWDEICRHSRRDQLSFDFVCWKLGIKYNCFNGVITNNKYFRLFGHANRNFTSAIAKLPELVRSDRLKTGRSRNFFPRSRRANLLGPRVTP